MVSMIDYLHSDELLSPCFVLGDSWNVLAYLHDDSIDCVITSSPYDMKRED